MNLSSFQYRIDRGGAGPMPRPARRALRWAVGCVTRCAPGRYPAALALATAAAFAPGAGFAADDAAVPAFSSSPAGEPSGAWHFAGLPRKTPTSFAIVDLGGARALKVEAADSYGNLVHTLHVQLSDPATLAWRWRVDELVDAADIRTRAGDDSPAKLCVFFAFDAGKLSLGERTRLALARSTAGEDVPAETLCYVWDNKLPADTALPNAFTKRIRTLVLQSGTGRLGQWIAQKRNLVADYQRLFGDESEGKVPEVIGIAVAADADNIHGHSLAYFGDIVLTP